MERIQIPEFENYIREFGVHKYKMWTVQEEDVLREYYGIIPTNMLADYLGRSIKAIHDKAAMLGVTCGENQKKREDRLDPSR